MSLSYGLANQRSPTLFHIRRKRSSYTNTGQFQTLGPLRKGKASQHQLNLLHFHLLSLPFYRALISPPIVKGSNKGFGLLTGKILYCRSGLGSGILYIDTSDRHNIVFVGLQKKGSRSISRTIGRSLLPEGLDRFRICLSRP